MLAIPTMLVVIPEDRDTLSVSINKTPPILVDPVLKRLSSRLYERQVTS